MCRVHERGICKIVGFKASVMMWIAILLCVSSNIHSLCAYGAEVEPNDATVAHTEGDKKGEDTQSASSEGTKRDANPSDSSTQGTANRSATNTAQGKPSDDKGDDASVNKPSRMIREPKPPADGEEEQSTLALLPQRPSERREQKQPSARKRAERKRRKLEIRGSAFVSYNVQSVKASSSAGRATFMQENYGMAQRLYHYSSLTIEGPLFDKLRIRAQFNTPSYSARSNTLLLEYPMGNLLWRFGDMNLSLSGNQFVTLNRWTRGWQLRYSLDGKAEDVYQIGQSGVGNEIVIVTAEGKSQVKYDRIMGNNTPGPYFLSYSPIVEGSERVLVDMRVMKRGEDYQIDYDSGMLTFLGATVIPPTSTIVVTYEAARPGESIGRFWGMRANIRASRQLRIGATYLTQRAAQRGFGSNTRRRREEFLGGNSVGPFQLSLRPIVVGSEQVTVNGIPQVRDRDYIINYISGLITFVRPVPSGAIVVVEYDQQTSHGAVIGQHQVLGLDMDWGLGKFGSMSLQWALSRGPRRSGMALELRTQFSIGKLGGRRHSSMPRTELNLRWRRVDPGFSRIENADFYLNESGFEAYLTHRFASHLVLTSQFTHGRSSSLPYFGFGSYSARGTSTTNRQLSFALSFNKPKLPQLRLAHQRYSTRSSSGSSNQYASTSAMFSYQRGHWSFDGAWESTAQSYGGSFSYYGYGGFASGETALTNNGNATGSSSNEGAGGTTSGLIYGGLPRTVVRQLGDSTDEASNALNTPMQKLVRSATTRTMRYRFSTRFQPSQKLSLSADWSMSKVTGAQFSSNTSNLVFNLSYEPWQSVRLFISHQILNGSSGAGLGTFIAGGAAGAYSGLPYMSGAYSSVYSTSYYGGYKPSFGGYGTFGAGIRPTTGLGGYTPSYEAGGYSYGSYGNYSWSSSSTSPYGYESYGWGVTRQRMRHGRLLRATGINNRQWTSGYGYGSGLAYGGGYGYGYDGGYGSAYTSSAGSTHNKSIGTTITLDLQPSSRLSLLCQWTHQLTRGSSFLTDYASTDWGVQFGYQLASRFAFTGQWSRQKQSFLQSGGDTFTTVQSLGIQYIGNRFNASLFWNRLSSVSYGIMGGSTYGYTPSAPVNATTEQLSEEPLTSGALKNAFSSITLDASWRITKRINFTTTFVHARNRGLGSYVQNSLRMALGYRIFSNVWLDFNLERIDRKDTGGFNNDYKATIFSVQLRGNF